MAGEKKKSKAVIKRSSAAKKTLSSTVTKKALVKQKADKSFYIVGIGASAGGLEAFAQFFNNMPPDSGMAFVLIPHLDPTHKSIIDELLRKYTQMPVQQVEDGMKVSPDNVYVIPPDKNMAIFHGRLQLIDPTERRGLRHPIDFFFRTLAEDQGEKAISIVLSGTGTEGALGLKAVKGEGGLVIVQDTKSAKYDGMPRSAIATGLVDYILPAEEMPDQLVRYITRSYAMPKKTAKQGLPRPNAQQKIFILIRNQTGHDFSYYKPNTINRRLERRMTVHQIETLSDYVKYLQNNPSEIDLLFKELLIRVTNFFRDPKAFELLKKKALPALFKNSPFGHPWRFWVAGCSTGEEAYSIAIAFHEYMSDHKLDNKVQIFATDIDNEAIEIARNGVYPESISVDVSAKRLKRYFIQEDNTYRIKKDLREMVVFAVQNLIKDPPFSKIDLLSCRNLLIYFGSELQKKLIPLFHYSLSPEGLLFLGPSETIGSFAELFTVFNSRWKLFKPKNVASHPMMMHDFPPTPIVDLAQGKKSAEIQKPMEVSLTDLTEKMLLEIYAPSCVVISENGNILYFYGRTGRYLEPTPGKASLNIFDMAREGLKLEIRTAVRIVIEKKEDAFFEGLKVKTNGGLQNCNLRVKPIKEPNHLRGLIMVVFEDMPAPLPVETKKNVPVRVGSDGLRVEELEFALKSTREQLQTTIEELEASNEELQSTNEELQSANEELQSTNEELETSKEELQSVNEELMMVNAEGQTKIEELTGVNNDMNNLLASTDVATVFLDNELLIKRFTPAAAKVIKLIQTDIGRPISDIASTLEHENLHKDVKNVLGTLIPVEKEVLDKKGCWYLVRIMPYRTFENVIDGVIITLIDITLQKQVQSDLTDARDYLEGIVETVRESLLILGSDLRVLTANNAFYKTFNVIERETENKLIYELGDHQWDIPGLRKLLEEILPKDKLLNGYEVEHHFPLIGKKTMLLNARRIMLHGKGTDMILLAIEDVTKKK